MFHCDECGLTRDDVQNLAEAMNYDGSAGLPICCEVEDSRFTLPTTNPAILAYDQEQAAIDAHVEALDRFRQTLEAERLVRSR